MEKTHILNAAWPHVAHLPQWMQEPLAHLTGLARAKSVYEQIGGACLAERLLHLLRVDTLVTEADLSQIPSAGPAVVVANHPHGILDGAVLLAMLRRRRSDVKFLANHALRAFPELRDVVVPLDLEPGARNISALRDAVEFVRRGGMLVVFPAGEVAQGTADAPWNDGTAKLLDLVHRSVEFPIVPIHIAGRNSLLFHLTGHISKRLRTAMLFRELWNKEGRSVEVRIGKGTSAERVLRKRTPARAIQYLRWRVELLSKRTPYRAHTSRPLHRGTEALAPVAPAVDPALLEREIDALPAIAANGNLTAHIATASEIPFTLRELGRLRELTFRAAGEGTGNTQDIDEFDAHYLHLFLWNAEAREIAGAYRMKPVTPGVTRPHDLYTSTLFRYGDKFLHGLGAPSLELGRSFICANYQRSFSALLLLWKGIGAWVAAHPRHRVLFGPVSISNAYSTESRKLMLAFLRRAAWMEGTARWIHGRVVPRWRTEPDSVNDIDDLDDALTELEGAKAPILLRQYLRLGGKLAGFHLDAAFSSTLDGMIVVDLLQADPKLLDRYFTKEGADALRACHRKENTSLCPTSASASAS
ncbi:MAG: GNAT family N-acetyltransferase [Acidobacteria bacterium]|nr:GNAT family N-acetyltransferase [Acidobacteriota bacterium]